MSAAILQADKLSLSFGGLRAVWEFQLAVPRGEIHGLIGPNGAGKTTCFNLLTGVYRPDAGDIRLAGRSLRGLRPYQICSAGVARTFQNIRLFANMSVLDNVRVACHVRARHGLPAALLRTAGHLREELGFESSAYELLDLLGLAGRADDFPRNLPYGEQRRLEIARALATRPVLLLLDEPAAGMNTNEKLDLSGLIRSIRERFDLTILLIEHDMRVVMDICDRITVLDHGVVIACDSPQRIQNDPKVIEAYLGVPEDANARQYTS